VSEERFTRIKNQWGYPKEAVDWCLEHEGIAASDLDSVVLASYHLPRAVYDDKKTVHGAAARIAYWGTEVERNLPSRGARFVSKVYRMTDGVMHLRQRKSLIASSLGLSEDRIIVVDHHEAHAYTTLLCSQFRKETLVLTMDGEGDGLCSTVSAIEEDSLHRLVSSSYTSSLGYLYRWTTKYLGMKPNEHEYKVMGLAPYAAARDAFKVYRKMRPLIKTNDDGSFTSAINMRYADKWLKSELYGTRFDWVAGGVQMVAEDVLSTWVATLLDKYCYSRLALGGGVFMNVKANMVLSELPQVEQLFVMPSCGDESLAIGAALMGYGRLRGRSNWLPDIPPLAHLYLGPEYEASESNIKRLINTRSIEMQHHTDIDGAIADLLSEGKVVGRFSGRAEWGARALGNRSILARADNIDVVEEINNMIKQRDFWMPFAPTILSDRESDYIINPKHFPAPYMIMAFRSSRLGQRDLRAAMHPSDRTLRPQILDPNWNPHYYSVLKQFEKRTGIGGILNTSFNLHGEPIVNSIEDAVSTFSRSGLRYLALGEFLLSKS
jgi:carbamoyltransferase